VAGGNHPWFPSLENLLFYRYSLLPALTMDGMIYAKVVEGSFTAETFFEFILGLLDRMDQSMPQGSVIVMDNAGIHKDPSLREVIEAR
jgi:hypothetical protein